MTTRERRPPRQLGKQLGHVLADLPVFLTSPLYRGWHLRWGATPDEVHARMTGDDLLPQASYRSTRAIDIQAPPDAVWPWLVQVGCLRAGWYSNDLLDNLARPSATTILPELQHLTIGQWVPMSPSKPTDRTALKVYSFDMDRWMLWTKPDCTWMWQLTPSATGGTRLVTRIRTTYNWGRPASALLGLLLMELGDFAMLRRMLRGIKARAEALEALRVTSVLGAPPDAISRGDYVDLYWLPLGAGGRSVRLNGRLFEAVAARRGHRRAQNLYHSALEVRTGSDTYVVEMTPAWGTGTAQRGVVCEGPVGARLLGRFRLFRYEIRRWRGGAIGDVADAVGPARRVSSNSDQAQQLRDMVSMLPTCTWGRDEEHAGDMWNSNSVTSWLLARSGHDMPAICPPTDGRAPGWAAGLELARRGTVQVGRCRTTDRPAGHG